MNFEENRVDIMILGCGREFFDPIAAFNKIDFSTNNCQIHIGEGFSALDITNVIVTIGVGVIAGLSTHLLAKLIDSIFIAKNKAKENGININIEITVVQGDQYIQIGSDQKRIKEEIAKMHQI